MNWIRGRGESLSKLGTVTEEAQNFLAEFSLNDQLQFFSPRNISQRHPLFIFLLALATFS